ncbi:MAG: MobQ family relaxase [Micavibrio sp.]
MAIYHCSLRVFTRSQGHSAVAAAAYRAGVTLTDERAGRVHRYEARHGVIDTFLLLPAGAPASFTSREVLWNAAEAAENRKNSCVAREVILALPHELSDDGRASLARDMALWLVERYRVAVDVAIHAPVAKDGHDHRNHHAHLLFTTRALTPDGFAAKTRILDDKVTGKQETETLRLVWESLANDALAQAGFADIRIDRRSLAEQGVERIPQTHTGRVAEYAPEVPYGAGYEQTHSGKLPHGQGMAASEEGPEAFAIAGPYGEEVFSRSGGERDYGPDDSLEDDTGETEDDEEEDGGQGDQQGKQQGGGRQGSASGGRSHSPSKASPSGKVESVLKEQDKGAIDASIDQEPLEDGQRLADVRQVTDKGSRTDFRAEIEALNEVRAGYGPKPLKEQIATIERLMEVVDHRVRKLEILERKTALSAVLAKSIVEAVNFMGVLIFQRQKGHALLALNEAERLRRAQRQQARYGRIYRSGIHEQIHEMKTLLSILEARQEAYQRYEKFVGLIEREIVKLPSIRAIHPAEGRPATVITTAESALKLILKAQMIRENIPPEFKAAEYKKGLTSPKNHPATTSIIATHISDTKRIETIINHININRLKKISDPIFKVKSGDYGVKDILPVNGRFRERAGLTETLIAGQKPEWKQVIRGFDPLAIQAKVPSSLASQTALARRERWFIPAGENTRSLEKTINAALGPMREAGAVEDNRMSQSDSLRTRFTGHDTGQYSGKTASRQGVTEALKLQAAEVRKVVAPVYRREAYEGVGSTQSIDQGAGGASPQLATTPRMAAGFNRAAGQGAAPRGPEMPHP